MVIGFVMSLLLEKGLVWEACIWDTGRRENNLQRVSVSDVQGVRHPCGFGWCEGK